MKVALAKENGIYFDHLAANLLLPRNTELFLFSTYQSLFSRLDLDPSLFAIVPINDSVNGVNLSALLHLFSKKYKIFAEIYLAPEFKLFYTTDLKDTKNQKIHWDKMTSELCFQAQKELKENNFIISENLEEIIEANPYNLCFIASKRFPKDFNIKVSSENIDSPNNLTIRYFIIGRAFYDLPSDESDKVILILKIKNSIKQDEIEEIIQKDGLNIFKIIKNPKSTSKTLDEYYLELGFYGLLDLHDLEKVADSLHILGIFESGKVHSV